MWNALVYYYVCIIYLYSSNRLGLFSSSALFLNYNNKTNTKKIKNVNKLRVKRVINIYNIVPHLSFNQHENTLQFPCPPMQFWNCSTETNCSLFKSCWVFHLCRSCDGTARSWRGRLLLRSVAVHSPPFSGYKIIDRLSHPSIKEALLTYDMREQIETISILHEDDPTFNSQFVFHLLSIIDLACVLRPHRNACV